MQGFHASQIAVGWSTWGLDHDQAYALETLEDPAHRRPIGRLFELVRDGLVGGGALLAHPVPPIATGQASTTCGASNKKACQVLHWSPIYPSWREGFVQAAQEWGKQKGTSETEKT